MLVDPRRRSRVSEYLPVRHVPEVDQAVEMPAHRVARLTGLLAQLIRRERDDSVRLCVRVHRYQRRTLMCNLQVVDDLARNLYWTTHVHWCT